MVIHVYRTAAAMQIGVDKLIQDGFHLRDMQILPDGSGGWIVLVEK